MSQHKLEVKNLYKKYARRVVVNDVSFSVSAGEIVGLLGPNGAGKTTCFYIACGLVRSSKGEVILDNKSIGHMPIHKRANLGIGYLPQEPSIFRKLSVQDNIMAVLEMNKSILPKDRVVDSKSFCLNLRLNMFVILKVLPCLVVREEG